MAESSRSSMAESSRSREQFAGMSVNSGMNNVGVMEKLDTYLKLAKSCMDGVQGLSSPKFNNEQCGYLVDKLKATLYKASLFMEGSQDQPCGPYISMKFARQVKNFEHLVMLAKHIESFVEDCSKDAWLQSAMTLASATEYVSSLGLNLELCGIALCNEQSTPGSLTIDEIGRINKYEAQVVEKIAFIDENSLLKNVTLQLNSSTLEDQNLAKYIIHRLVGVQPKPTSNDENILFRLFEWVVSGKKFKKLGRGSSATVYEVMWLGTPVAKKTFDGPENEEFLKEVEILSQLCHPNITSMFCCHMNKRNCSIIMELMDGNLRDLIEGRLERNNDFPPFTILEGLDIMLQMGEGVNYLHNKRIVHRDLKSANILIKSVEISGLKLGYVQAKVVDFGLSKTKEKSTTYSNMTYNMGTFRWMAPEVINIIKGNQESFKANVNLLKHVFKVDIYSFAMVCFEILTGEVPFSSESVPRKVKEKILKGERPRIPDYCPSMLKSLIEKCWSQVPSERPSIGDVCLQLKYIKYLLITRKRGVGSAQPRVVLDWMQRVYIALDVARGLKYIHKRTIPPIIHGDICSNNVLLFSSHAAKVDTSNFWKSKLKKTLVGDPLYYAPGHKVPYGKGIATPAAPEQYMLNSGPTQKSDVYSFGVVLLELLTGNKCSEPTLSIDQLCLVREALSRNKVIKLIDPKIESSFPPEVAEKMVAVLCNCLEFDASFRPHMSTVVKALEEVLEIGYYS